MTNNYATVLEFNNETGSEVTDPVQIEVVQRFLDASAQLIDKYCNRPEGFLALTSATEKTLSGNGQMVMRIPENTAVTVVKVKADRDDDTYETWASTDYVLFSGDVKQPNFERKPYDHIMLSGDGEQTVFTNGVYYKYSSFKGLNYRIPIHVPTVKITAKWGYADTLPSQIKTCTLLQAVRWFKRSQGTWADDIGNVDFGSLGFIHTIDHDINLMLNHGRFIKPAI